jgi:putative ABC transport system permease protein
MQSIWLDVATAFRFFARRKAAAAAVILTMALALAANTTAFTVLHAFLFGNLAIPDSDRVVVIPTTKDLPGRGRVDFSDAYVNYLLLKQTTHCFTSFAAALPADVNWSDAEDTRRLEGSRISASFFDVMEVRPQIGRPFSPKEEGPHAAPVAIISHQLWRSAFNANPNVLGTVLRLNGVPHTLIGVMPTGFAQPAAGGAGIDVWLPFDLPEGMWNSVTGARQINTYARLAPGITIAAADKELRTFATRAQEADPMNKDWSWRASRLRDQLLDGSGNVVIFVQSGALVLLLLAICNLGSVLIAWGTEREHETALRFALGATSWRVIRQFIIQSLLLVGVGGVLAVGLTWFALPALKHLNPNPSLAALLRNVQIDWNTIVFAFFTVTVTALVIGILPALLSRSLALESTLRSQSRGGSANPTAVRWQKAMVTFQAGISVLILVCATIAAIGLEKVSRVRRGFEQDGRVCFHIEFPEPAYAKHEQRVGFVRALESNLAKEPALAGYGLTTTLPVGDGQWGGNFVVQLDSGEFTQEPAIFHYRRVSPGYLSAMGIPLVEGRMLSERDQTNSQPVAVVSKALADKYWPNQSPLGRKIKRPIPADSPAIEVVGVVGDVLDAGTAVGPGQTVYVPFEQFSLRRASIVLNGRGSTADTVAAGRRALRLTSSDLAAFGIEKLELLSWQANALPRLQMILFAAFAIVAVGITVLGTYGVMSQLVRIRQKELAIRTALGAPPNKVLGLVLLQNARLAVAGTAAGTLVAWFTARWLQSQLTSFDASIAWPFATVAAGILFLTQAASWLPARQATKLDVQSVLASA